MKKIGIALFRKLGILKYYTLSKSGYLREKGWFSSFRSKKSVDAKNEPYPWFTYPFTDFISDRLTSEMTVFEFGSGNSSLWLKDRVGHIISCEHHKEWYEQMKPSASGNLELLFHSADSYAQSICKTNRKFDIVIIDGIDRVSCAIESLEYLTEHGVIIWDDSVRLEYKEGFEQLRLKGFKQIDFCGMTPVTEQSSATSIFYKEKNCLRI